MIFDNIVRVAWDAKFAILIEVKLDGDPFDFGGQGAALVCPT